MSDPRDRLRLLQQRIATTRTQLRAVVEQASNAHLRSCWPRWEHVLEGLSEQVACKPEVAISLVGGTGAGKTTLINALIGSNLLPTKAGAACTSAVCEIGFAADGKFHGEVLFISREQWQQEVNRLKADLAAALQDSAEDSEQDRKVSSFLRKAAFQKLKAVFRAGANVQPAWFLQNNLQLSQAVARALNVGREEFTCDTAEKFSTQIKHFLTADDPIWPVVKAVRISGPFAALETGVKLIDLPGVNDPNEAREAVTRQHLKECKFAWIVFSMKRALGKDVVELMQGEDLFRQLLMDGQADRLAFVATHSDDINFDEMEQDASLNGVLASRKSNIRASLKQTLDDLAFWMAGKAEEEQSKAQALADRLSRFALFTVSARDYLALEKKTRNRPVLETTEQSELPALREYIAAIGQQYGLDKHARAVEQQLEALFLEVRQEHQGQKVRVEQQLEMKARQREEVRAALSWQVGFLERDLTEHRDRYAQDLRACGNVLAERFKRGVERGRLVVNQALSKWEQMHHNTLGAICRNNGRLTSTTGTHDLPQELAQPLLDSIAFTWDEFFGARLNGVMDEWYAKLGSLAERSAEKCQQAVASRLEAGSRVAPEIARLQEATAKVLAEQLAQSRALTDERIECARVGLYERVPVKVRASLRPAFAGAGKESGPGMKRRMIDDHLRGAVLAVAREIFSEAEKEIGNEVRALQDTMSRHYHEMTETVARHAHMSVDNFVQDAGKMTVEAVQRERKNLDAFSQTVDRLAAWAPEQVGRR